MDIPLRVKLQASSIVLALLGTGLMTAVVWSVGQVPHLTAKQWFLIVALGVVPAVALAVVTAGWLAQRLSKRIGLLAGAAEELEHGNLQARVPEPAHARQDEIKHLQVVFNDMATALQERDEELRQSHRQLGEMTRELQRWNADYLSTLEFITHELKNQIASARLNLLAMTDGYVGELTAEQRETLTDVLHTVNRTEDMLVNYLNLSCIEKGELQVRARPVRIASEVVEPVLRDLRPRIQERQMRVEVELPDELVTQADPTLLQTVYENLLTNAAKYGRPGGLIRLWGKAQNGMLEMHVWNEGQGVAPDQIDQLFGKFCRLAPPGEEARGTGLGLFIDREIVRRHGGEIRAESKFGEWIDFVFTLPRPDEILRPTAHANEPFGGMTYERSQSSVG